MRPHSAHVAVRRFLAAAGIGSLGSLGLLYAGGVTVAGADPGGSPAHPHSTFEVTQILSGKTMHHSFTPMGSTAAQTETLSKPDDITRLGDELFVGFQNGVGPQGEPSTTDGNLDSTVVEFTMSGHPVAQWDVQGKTDGLSADRKTGTVIATVNEDANSSLYVIDPGAGATPAAVTKYAYNEALPHAGGTDAISIFHGAIFISASAPGTTGAPAPQPTYPAVYSVTLNPTTKVATVTPLFLDEAAATVANHQSPQFGQSTTLALTDPDSNEVVPRDAPRFGGDFMLTSQGDLQQIYVDGAAGPAPKLSVLSLSQSVDDTAWPTDPSGSLFATDSTNDAVDVVTGPFSEDQPIVAATPCGSNSAPSTCPAPGFGANFLGTLDPWTGQVSALALPSATAFVPQGGLVFVKGHSHDGDHGRGGDE